MQGFHHVYKNLLSALLKTLTLITLRRSPLHNLLPFSKRKNGIGFSDMALSYPPQALQRQRVDKWGTLLYRIVPASF